MTDEAVALNVKDELFWDPKVDSEEIAVCADDGTITLRGTVGSFRQKRDAKKAAERVHGVVYVDNELSVRILTKSRRADADLRGDVLQAMLLDSLIPTTVDAKIQDGYVTLSGAVDWQYQRDEATFVAGNVLGVTGVDNEILVGGDAHTAGEVSDDIQKAADLAATGLTNKQIAERLFLSHRTVASHLHRLYPKLGVASRTALRAALEAMARGEIPS